ncbi:MAG: hypothetical protein LAP86_09795 [Acidobacteriia bacterium]|nr:hypothetical protein [Terriglobia bacterium]
MTTALRPLSTGELLDRTFSLYRSHFGLFVGIFALPHLVVLGVQFLQLMSQRPYGRAPDVFASLLWFAAVAFVGLVMAAASQAAAVVAVSDLHLDRSASVMDSFIRVKGHLPGVIGISIIVIIGVWAGMVALLVPGILLAIIWSLSVPAKVLENKGVLSAMARSVDLTKGDWGRIFVVGLLVVVLSYGVRILLQAPILIATYMSAKAGMRAAVLGWQIASLVAAFVAESLVGAVGTIAFSLVYYDERVRKEAFDLQLMMSTIDAAALPGSPAQVGA